MIDSFEDGKYARKFPGKGYCCFDGYYIRDAAEIVVSRWIDGLPVRELVARAFQYTGAKRVTLPDGIRNIRDAFRYCDKLEQVNIPASTQRIEAYAFQDCTNLMRLRIPASVTFIEDREGQVPFIGCGSAKKTGKHQNKRVKVGPYRVPLCGFDSETRYTYGDLTLIVDRGSYAEKYAKRMNIKYELVQETSQARKPDAASEKRMQEAIQTGKKNRREALIGSLIGIGISIVMALIAYELLG